MSTQLNTIYFVNKFGSEKKQVPFPVSPNLKLMDIIPEISKKFGILSQNICLANMGGQVLTSSDLMKPIKELVDQFGNTFDIIDRGVVGDTKPTEIRWQRSILDEVIEEFPSEWVYIGPKHPAWRDRIKLEIEKILKYVEFLKINHSRAWFKLFPEKDRRYNYLVWTGEIVVPERPEIKFEIKLLLTSEYPKVSPRCFAEEKIVDYCGKLFLKNIWVQNGKKYIMICHEHMANTQAWNNHLGIAHFFIRQVWVWWAAQQNVIIKEFDKKRI
ncbi:MAG: hypothetical protein BAJALOKI1v1_780010 [Promethearchaeota archaeon]|nr:MAG: hypothetical protein BAJALOKI1v1_780010 [Candidatus Lokiarchaeota archaeon]